MHASSPRDGCGIYATRPRTCHEYFCGFRRLDWVPESLRPDLSDVLTGLRYDAPPSDAKRRLGVSFFLLSRAALEAESLPETVAAAVTAGLPTDIRPAALYGGFGPHR